MPLKCFYFYILLKDDGALGSDLFTHDLDLPFGLCNLFFAQVSVFALTGLDLDLFVPKRLFTKKKILEVCLDTIFTQKYFGKSSILHEESTILILQLFIKLLVTSTLQASVAI